MSRTLDLSRNARVVLDGSGNGTVQLGPSLPGEVWSPVSCTISCTGSQPTTGTPTVFLYAGNGVSPGTQIDSTYNVLGAASSMISGKTLYAGQLVSAVWSGGPAGQTATLAVNGTRKVP